jgi:hypothetical protein
VDNPEELIVMFLRSVSVDLKECIASSSETKLCEGKYVDEESHVDLTALA